MKNPQTSRTSHEEPIPLLFNKTLDKLRSVGARGGRARARNLRVRRCESRPALCTPTAIEQNKERTAEAVAILDAKFPWLIGAERKGTLSRV